jgi:hypothetical protein
MSCPTIGRWLRPEPPCWGRHSSADRSRTAPGAGLTQAGAHVAWQRPSRELARRSARDDVTTLDVEPDDLRRVHLKRPAAKREDPRDGLHPPCCRCCRRRRCRRRCNRPRDLAAMGGLSMKRRAPGADTAGSTRRGPLVPAGPRQAHPRVVSPLRDAGSPRREPPRGGSRRSVPRSGRCCRWRGWTSGLRNAKTPGCRWRRHRGLAKRLNDPGRQFLLVGLMIWNFHRNAKSPGRTCRSVPGLPGFEELQRPLVSCGCANCMEVPYRCQAARDLER